MPDITMCEGGDCTLKHTCYRFKATPSEYQSYSNFHETFTKDEEGIVECEHYWMVDKLGDYHHGFNADIKKEGE